MSLLEDLSNLSKLSLPSPCVQGIVSTPGFCKFSAWKRESDLPRQPFSGWLLGCLAAHPPARTWIKDISTGRSIAFGEVRGHVDRIAKVS